VEQQLCDEKDIGLQACEALAASREENDALFVEVADLQREGLNELAGARDTEMKLEHANETCALMLSTARQEVENAETKVLTAHSHNQNKLRLAESRAAHVEAVTAERNVFATELAASQRRLLACEAAFASERDESAAELGDARGELALVRGVAHGGIDLTVAMQFAQMESMFSVANSAARQAAMHAVDLSTAPCIDVVYDRADEVAILENEIVAAWGNTAEMAAAMVEASACLQEASLAQSAHVGSCS